MSNETMEEQKQELKELEAEIEQVAAEEKAKAAQVEPEPSPEPVASPEPEPTPEPEAVVTPQQSEAPQVTEKPKDDPMEWARKKGFKSPEDMARALLQKEQEFHDSRQKAKAEAQQLPPMPPQNWNPAPQMGYPAMPNMPFYQPQPAINPRQVAALYPSLAPEDVERVMPLIVDAAEAISNRKMAAFEQRFGAIQRTTERNSELMTLMQDPAFRNEAVQREIHSVLEADPSIYQRERSPNTYAFEKALSNLARKQLQQGVATDTPTGSKPPVTAGGGNGSAFTVPVKITEKDFDRWTLKEQEAFINSNGKIVPKK